MVGKLRDAIRRSEESRYAHRLHAVLLVVQGMTCQEVSRLQGDAPRAGLPAALQSRTEAHGARLEAQVPTRPA
jgi:hypothetical protein